MISPESQRGLPSLGRGRIGEQGRGRRGLWPTPVPTEPFHPHAQGALLPQPPGKLGTETQEGCEQQSPRGSWGGRGGCGALPITASCRQKNTNQFV